MSIEIEDLVVIVSNYFNISPVELFTKTRVKHIAEARQFFFCIARRNTHKSLDEIGQVAINYERVTALDHATVLHGANKIKDLCSVYPKYKNDLKQLQEAIDVQLLNHGMLYELIPGSVNLLAICKDKNLTNQILN